MPLRAVLVAFGHSMLRKEMLQAVEKNVLLFGFARSVMFFIQHKARYDFHIYEISNNNWQVRQL